MQNKKSTNNKRIAKNTLFLYFRMLFMMAVSLYTSRVILNTLGIEDYGVYNVVGGVVSMLGFLNGALGGASSRFITYDLGIKDISSIKKTFGNILSIHFILAGIILLLGETIGLWFVNTQLKIPSYRFIAALWVYQFSLFSLIMSVICIPYNATIIAHEKMGAFAYISIIDTLLKLFIVYLLVISPFDKLIVYSILYFCIQLFNQLVYMLYCKNKFQEVHTSFSYDKKIFSEIFEFAGWTMNGYLAIVGYTQGINILLNIFFGPVVNAARGIAVQVQNVCQQFCTNFQMALNPQMTKNYAQHNLNEMHSLLIKSSKFSFYILFIIVLPLMFVAPIVLKVWLGNIPPHTVNFLRLILFIGLLYPLTNPLIVSVHATGHLRKFQLIEGSLLLSIVPLAYVILKFFHLPPESVFVVHLFVEFFTLLARLKIVLPMIGFKLNVYIQKVIIPIVIVVLCAPIIPYVVYLHSKIGIFSSFYICVTCTISLLLIIYFLGCTSNEKKFIIERMKIIYLHFFMSKR